ncbi:Asp_Arg_hydrox domain-containing protein, partial [Haematococcus lacustris]
MVAISMRLRGHDRQAEQTIPISEQRLMLASHSRLMWYALDSGEVQVLHEGGGVHYGVFPGGQRSVWVVLRPHNWRPLSQEEQLLEIDTVTGAAWQ